MNNVHITIAEVWFSGLISLFLPVIVAFITKRYADSNAKTATLAVLSAISAALIQLGNSFSLSEFLTALVFIFFTSVGIHYQVLKKVGITGADGAAANLPGIADKGIG